MMRTARAILSCTGIAACINAPVRGDDWPQWRGPTRDAVWHETGITRSFPKDGLRISWRAPVGRGWSSPLIANGRVFLTDAQIQGTNAIERVLCFAEENGQLLWNHSYPANYPAWAFDPNGGGPRSTPIVAEGKIYTLGAMGHLLCLDASTGAVVWKKDLEKEYAQKEFTGITASPLVDGERLILYICGKPGACVVALNRNSGKEIWRALDDSFTYSSPIILEASGRKELVVWTQEAVSSLNPADGKVWWRNDLRTTGDTAVATPVYSEPLLLVGGLMLKMAASKPGASTLWPKSEDASERLLSNTSTALVKDGAVYSAKISGELVCLDAQTGAALWRTNTITDLKNGASIHITMNGDAAFLFTNEGNLICARVNREGYQEFGRARLLDGTYAFGGRKVAWAPPAYANGHVFGRNDLELVRASLRPKE